MVSFFSGIKKALGKVVKVAAKTAPIWSNFIPGGSLAATLVTKGASILSTAKAARNKIKQLMKPAGSMALPPLALPMASAAGIVARTAAHHSRKILAPGRHGGMSGPAAHGHGPNRWHHVTPGLGGHKRIGGGRGTTTRRYGTRGRAGRRLSKAQKLYFGTRRQRAAAQRAA